MSLRFWKCPLIFLMVFTRNILGKWLFVDAILLQNHDSKTLKLWVLLWIKLVGFFPCWLRKFSGKKYNNSTKFLFAALIIKRHDFLCSCHCTASTCCLYWHLFLCLSLYCLQLIQGRLLPSLHYLVGSILWVVCMDSHWKQGKAMYTIGQLTHRIITLEEYQMDKLIKLNHMY